MNFANLYKKNREAVTRALTSMWCGESGNDSQAATIARMKEVIARVFAPQEAVPVAQCMNSYKGVHSVSADEAKGLVAGLWQRNYPPYEHQYQAWKTLLRDRTEDGHPMSVVVTTGTGSGKTECFMMPLVRDLIDNPAEGVQALFLYPLNALMEDQKERLEELLKGTMLTYSVYNGDLPEREPAPDDNRPEARRLRRIIDQIRGVERDERGKEVSVRFPKMLYTREQVRSTPPAILLTNPTILEYILLRSADSKLTDPKKKSLRWVSIDETHTYTGAGAAELAMLLRRVLLAFGVKASDLRFATSSATFGDDEKRLREFIAGLTGVKSEQVRVIGGERQGADYIARLPEGEDRRLWQTLFEKEYVSLAELYPEMTGDVEGMLRRFDALCSRVESARLKAKMHYFYRVPTGGLFVRLTEHEDGAFRLYTENTTDGTAEGESPLLELSRCKHCGEYVAVARVNKTEMTYEPLVANDSDMFDLPEEEEDEDGQEMGYAIFALTKGRATRGDNNATFSVVAGRLEPFIADTETDGSWHIVGNMQRECPYCGTKLTRGGSEDAEDDATGDMDARRLQKFRLSAEFISRLLAPSVLDQLDPMLVEDPATGQMIPDPELLHGGQQYISFVDSRQTAAKQTMRLNEEEERMWFYSTVYHELCRIQSKAEEYRAQIAALRDKLHSGALSEDEEEDTQDKIRRLRKKAKGYLTWDETTRLIHDSEYCETFCNLFVKHNSESDEVDEDGSIKESVKQQYVQSLMVMYLGRRPLSAASPENLGLFHPCYPALDKIKTLPEEVETFNALIENPSDKITLHDWRSLLQLYMDYTVRSNQSVFLKIAESSTIDIMSSVRFATEKPRRRMARRPNTEKGNRSRIVMMLEALNARNGSKATRNDIGKVIDALWRTLTEPEGLLLEYGQTYNKETGQWTNDRSEPDEPWRYNLHNLCFTLYNDVYLADTNADGELHHSPCLRPVENHFKNFSPYLQQGYAVPLDETLHEQWTTYPLFSGSGREATKAELDQWAKERRSILWNNRLWGDDGVFADRLEDIHLIPRLFIQGEHTAQVDKMTSRRRQQDFKAHKVNILACSTTMEMGVDLGNLEVVMLTSVPPGASNYKQRAGRAGRNEKVRSACITLCGSDVVGLRTLYHPIEKIISRPVEVPTVDLKSPQVVGRHVNSYLIRAFGVFAAGENGGSLNQKVADYYTPFHIEVDADHKYRVYDGNNVAEPDKRLGSGQDTLYNQFKTRCQECGETLPAEISAGLEALLYGTVFEGQPTYVISKAREANDRCYAELGMKVEDLAYAYTNTTPMRPKFRAKLNMQYLEILGDRLLNYWATSRFTPNANMPVGVLALDLNTTGKRDFLTPSSSSNPTYSLREAISQYAPGNSVVVDGVVYTVRGIQFANQYQQVRSFKQIYRNKEKTVIGDGVSLSGKLMWMVNGKEALDLVQPTGFVPDMNEQSNRIIDDAQYTRVSAQLIDADEWQNIVTEPHLYSVRSNRETGDSRILYYNEGIGYGYCFCSRCGKTVLEEEAAALSDNPNKLPLMMNDRRSRRNEGQRFHMAVSGREANSSCGASNDMDLIKRNVIIGDEILTDYSEIRIRHKGKKRWLSNRDEEQNLLFTLGVAFSQSLVDILGKERNAVDFAITPNGHICIFDTNPGGAGYANQMANMQIMKEVVEATYELLREAKEKHSKDMLVDKSTLRYLKYIDIDAALSWIEEEHESCSMLPDNVRQVFPTATETSFNSLVEAYGHSFQETALFADDLFDRWNVFDVEHGWYGRYCSYFVERGGQTTMCVLTPAATLPPKHVAVENKFRAWVKDFKLKANPYSEQGIHPLAYIDDCLYFTNDEQCSSLNERWAAGTIYQVRCPKFWEH